MATPILRIQNFITIRTIKIYAKVGFAAINYVIISMN